MQNFFRCICFGKRGEAINKYFSKGHKIGIVGRLQSGSYTDKDGVKRYTTDIIVEDFDFCESKGNLEDTPSEGFLANNNVDDDLPFN